MSSGKAGNDGRKRKVRATMMRNDLCYERLSERLHPATHGADSETHNQTEEELGELGRAWGIMQKMGRKDCRSHRIN